jgi:hydroxypyruvate reductase
MIDCTVLEDIYRETLDRCAPERLIATVWREDFPRTVVAIGKCAGALRDGIDCDDAFVAIPFGYREPKKPAQVAFGTHPQYSEASFEAGRQLLEFVDRHDDITFIVSGGGSACVEVPIRENTVEENARLIASGMTIAEINARRKAMSAIKGGKLAERVHGHCVTLVYSDVSRGKLADVASGPTIPGSDEVRLIADNDTLTATAAAIARERGLRATVLPDQLESDVEEAAKQLAKTKFDDVLIAGGEITVAVHGDGKGGRCSELALRYLLDVERASARQGRAEARPTLLFGSSDGVDGNTGVAGILIDGNTPFDRHAIETELGKSNSFPLAAQIGRAIMIPPAGNNLRDLYLLARG